MLFNSYIFIFGFLPLTFVGFWWLTRYQHSRGAVIWLAVTSLTYYAWWSLCDGRGDLWWKVFQGQEDAWIKLWKGSEKTGVIGLRKTYFFLPLLLASIFVNYGFGYNLIRDRQIGRTRRCQVLLTLGLVFNLGLLAYFKYANFFIENFNALTGAHQESFGRIILPLGISFYTFQKIAYLVDAYRGEVTKTNFLDYLLFVTFFPQLIAGPIVHHKEIMPQFDRAKLRPPTLENCSLGLTLFVMGLFNKCLLADGIAPLANKAFDELASGVNLKLFEAWAGALAYSCQLYFDFSGYSYMAIGLGLFFNIRMPANFFSPYQAVNIIDFWRRWHMTLSRFLRDYLYISLGGNRRGPIRRYVNLGLTMVIGGFWHGAGWTWIVWGALHGLYLCVNHAWHAFRRFLGHDLTKTSRLGTVASRTLTFIAVVVGWVFFRAKDLDSAWRMMKGLFGFYGANLPIFLLPDLGFLAPYVKFRGWLPQLNPEPEATVFLAFLLIVIFACPNVLQMTHRFRPALGLNYDKAEVHCRPRWQFQYSVRWALWLGLAAALAVGTLSQVSEFLYFQF